MKSTKKVFAAVLTFLFVLASIPFSAMAAGETGNVTIGISSSSATGNNPGDIITITINIANDYNATAFRWPVLYSSTVFELYDGGSGNPGNVTAYGALAATGSSITAIDKKDDNAFYNTTYTKARYSVLLVQWIGGQNNGTANYYNEASGSACITFQLRVKDNPSATTGLVTITNSTVAFYSQHWYRQGITNPSDASTYYKIDAANYTVTTAVCRVGVYTLPAGIQAATGKEIIFNESYDIKYVYGFTQVAAEADYPYDDTTESMGRYLETTGGAVAVYTPFNDGYGTGTQVDVYTSTEYVLLMDGDSSTTATPFKTYFVVIFGDIDGDCYTTSTDAVMEINAINNVYEDWAWSIAALSPQAMACDINADEIHSGDDYGPVVDASNGLGYIAQTYSNTGYYVQF